MKTADEMFEELGCIFIYADEEFLQYKFEGIYMDIEIIFDLKRKTVLKEYADREVCKITIEELQAINKKVEELGWIK